MNYVLLFSVSCVKIKLISLATTRRDASWALRLELAQQRIAAASTRVHPMFSSRQNIQSFSSSLGNKTTLY